MRLEGARQRAPDHGRDIPPAPHYSAARRRGSFDGVSPAGVFRASSQPTQPRNSDRVTSPTAVAAFEDECRLPVIFCTPGNVLDPDSSFEKKTCTDPGHRYRWF